MESIRWMVTLAIRAGVERIVLNGSFVTDIMEPNDVDCVLLIPEGPSADIVAEAELREGLPFLDITIVGEKGFIRLVNRIFATDRFERPKGMIKVLL